MEANPLVSILLLSMNHEAFIEQCITSLKNQTYKQIEIIYLDNASSDNTYEKGKSLLKQSGIPFKCFLNKESKTISHNLNFLLDNCNGVFISPLSTDDWFESDNLLKKVNYFVSNPGLGALFSNGFVYDESKKQLELNDSSTFKRGHIYKEVLTNGDAIFYVGVIYKKEILDKVGKWDKHLLIEDTDMYIRISTIAPIDFIDEPLVYYRRTGTSASKNKEFMLKGFRQYYYKYKNVEWINMRKWLAERYRTMAASDIDEQNTKRARVFLMQAIKLNPLGAKNIQTCVYLIRQSLKPTLNRG